MQWWKRPLQEIVNDMIREEGAAYDRDKPIAPLGLQAKLDGFLDRLEARRKEALATFEGDCPECFDQPMPCHYCQRGRDYMDAAEEGELKEEIAAWQEGAGIPRSYRSFTLKSYPDQTVAKAFREDPVQPNQWLLLSGPVGVGKTGLVVALLHHHLVMAQHTQRPKPRALFVPSADLWAAIRNSFSGNTTEQVTRRYRTVPLLVIDDLGSERMTEWVQEQLFSIINHRYNEELATWVTTNHPLKLGERSPLADAVGDRVFWRIYERARPITLAGPNRRKRTGGTVITPLKADDT